MKVFFLIMFVILLTFGNCSSSINNSKKNKNVFCLKIDTLYDEYYSSSRNYFANQIIPVLVTESGIEANCHKGMFGYFYRSDSLFDADVEKWRKYFKCK